jgi:hypothetical protein
MRVRGTVICCVLCVGLYTALLHHTSLLSHFLACVGVCSAILAEHSNQLSEPQRAYIYYQDASILVYRGAWSDALSLLRAAKELLARSESHKKLREVLFLELYVLYHTASYTEAMRTCEELIELSVSDGDLYYECNAFYWRSLLLLVSDGASRDIEANLHNVQSVAEDLHLSTPSYRHAFDVLYLTNDFYLHHSPAPVLEWLDRNFEALRALPNKLMHHAPLYVGLCTLTMDVYRYGGPKLTAKDKKALLDRMNKVSTTTSSALPLCVVTHVSACLCVVW